MNIIKRTFTTTYANSYTRVIKYTGNNINVASHNNERRSEYSGDFNFPDSWGLGVEGFSHGPLIHDMDPLTGNKNEFKWLLFIVAGLIPIYYISRETDGKNMQAIIGVESNSYSELNLKVGEKIDTTF